MNGISHSWNGTVLTITSDSGTSSCDLKGEKGDDGVRGAQGSGIASKEDIDNALVDYMNVNYPEGLALEVDDTLSIEGQAADAKATGDAIANISIDMNMIVDYLHPIGSIYMTTESENPSIKWKGTTWVAWGSGRVPVGVDSNDIDFSASDKIGGSKEMQSHNHVYTPSGTINGVPVTGSVSPAKANISIVSTTATGLVDESDELKTGSAGIHRHIVPHDSRYTATSGSKGAVMVGYSSSNETTAAYSNRYTEKTGAHSHTIESHTHTFTGNPHTHSVTDSGHTHTVAIPTHNHTFTGELSNTVTSGTGNSQNLQPYITCYMWKRTA